MAMAAARGARRSGEGFDALAAAAAVRGFLAAHPAVWLVEAGQRQARLGGERSGYSLNAETGQLVCHFWTGDVNLVRRVVEVGEETAARLRLRCWRMGQAQPTGMVLE